MYKSVSTTDSREALAAVFDDRFSHFLRAYKSSRVPQPLSPSATTTKTGLHHHSHYSTLAISSLPPLLSLPLVSLNFFVVTLLS